MTQQTFFSGLSDAHRTLDELMMATKLEPHGDRLVDLMSRLDVTLRRHFEIEDAYLYPPLLDRVDDWEDRTVLLGAHEDHHVIMRLLGDLEATPPTDERFRGKVHTLDRLWQHHIHEEEGALYDMAQRYLGHQGFHDMWEEIRNEEKAQRKAIKADSRSGETPGEDSRTESRVDRQTTE